MSGVDLRGFAYAMQPLVRRRQWQADEGLRKLAAALQDLQRANHACEASTAACASHAEQARRAWRTSMDPGTYQRLLAYLAVQQEKGAQLEDRRAQLRLAHRQAQQDCLSQQRQLDGLLRHRQDCEDGYAAAERGRQLVQADQDWTARTHAARARTPA